jgi:hypothetical protein
MRILGSYRFVSMVFTLATLFLTHVGDALAQEGHETVAARAPGSVSDPLKLGRTVIMVSGENGVTARILEDALTARLLKQGIEIVSRPLVERALAREVERISTATESRKRSGDESSPVNSQLDAAAVGALVGAGTVLLCEIAEEARTAQTENPKEQGKEKRTEYLGGAKIVAGSLQVIRADSGELMGSIAIRCPRGVDGIQMSALLAEELLAL